MFAPRLWCAPFADLLRVLPFVAPALPFYCVPFVALVFFVFVVCQCRLFCRPFRPFHIVRYFLFCCSFRPFCIAQHFLFCCACFVILRPLFCRLLRPLCCSYCGGLLCQFVLVCPLAVLSRCWRVFSLTLYLWPVAFVYFFVWFFVFLFALVLG